MKLLTKAGLATGFGAGLGCAIANRLADAAARRRHEDVYRVAGEPYRVFRSGSGPNVLLVHGNGAMIEDMLLSGLVGRLQSTRDVVVPERPGYGAGDEPPGRPWSAGEHARYLARMIREQGLGRPVVLGHSLGALVALALALDAPDLVSGLVLVSGYYAPDPQVSILAQKLFTVPLLGPALIATSAPQLTQAALPWISRELFAPLPVPERFRQMPKDLLLRRAHLQATADGASLMVEDAARYERRIHELRIPVHLFAGEGDAIIRAPFQAEAFRQRYRPAELTLLPGTGHMAHYSATDAIAEAVLGMAA